MKRYFIRRGFTLVELLVVLAIFFIITTAGTITFSRYNTSQVLESSSKSIITFLNSAKVNAVTQTMPGSCTQNLQMYSVKIIDSLTYELWGYCNGTSSSLKTQKLPNTVSFDAGTSGEITFNAGTGLSNGGSIKLSIKLNGTYSTKNITIDTSGNITGN